MSVWLDFVQIVLALGLGWLVWALLRLLPAPGAPGAKAGRANGAQAIISRAAGYKGNHGDV